MRKFIQILLFVIAEVLLFRLIAIEYAKFYFNEKKKEISKGDCSREECHSGEWERKYHEKEIQLVNIYQLIEEDPFGNKIIKTN